MARVRLDFQNLPLLESAARISFAAPNKIALQNAVDLLERLGNRGEWSVSQPDRFEVPPGIDGAEIDVSSSFVLSNLDIGLAVTVQKQLIAARWSKSISPGNPYPRYAALRDTLWRTVDALTVMGALHSQVAVVNLLYVNFVHARSNESVLSDYFSSKVQVPVFQNAVSLQEYRLAWRSACEIDLRLEVAAAEVRFGPDIFNGYRLVTAGGNRLSGTMDARGELDRVHDSLQEMFRDVLSERAKSEWSLTEVPLE